MKITIDVDCTPQEARSFLGLPDVGPMQAAMLEEIQKRLQAGLESMDAETVMKTWLPLGASGTLGIENDGALSVRLESGEILVVRSGDVEELRTEEVPQR